MISWWASGNTVLALCVFTDERDGHEGSSSAQSERSDDESNNDDNDWDHESERCTSTGDSEELRSSSGPSLSNQTAWVLRHDLPDYVSTSALVSLHFEVGENLNRYTALSQYFVLSHKGQVSVFYCVNWVLSAEILKYFWCFLCWSVCHHDCPILQD